MYFFFTHERDSVTSYSIYQKEHNDTLAKLNFVLALVECIMDVARNRASPLAAALNESIHTRKNPMASSPPGMLINFNLFELLRFNQLDILRH